MKNTLIGAFDAKTHLSELLEKVLGGESFVITRRGKPVAELKPLSASSKQSLYGTGRGKVYIAADFDAPLDDFKDYR